MRWISIYRIIYLQLGKHEQVNEKDLREKWTGLCLDGAELTKLLHLNSLDSVFDWTKFIVVAAASVVKEVTEDSCAMLPCIFYQNPLVIS